MAAAMHCRRNLWMAELAGGVRLLLCCAPAAMAREPGLARHPARTL
jgi:hypothetical protein